MWCAVLGTVAVHNHHGTVLIIFPLILRATITVEVMSTAWRAGVVGWIQLCCAACGAKQIRSRCSRRGDTNVVDPYNCASFCAHFLLIRGSSSVPLGTAKCLSLIRWPDETARCLPWSCPSRRRLTRSNERPAVAAAVEILTAANDVTQFHLSCAVSSRPERAQSLDLCRSWVGQSNCRSSWPTGKLEITIRGSRRSPIHVQTATEGWRCGKTEGRKESGTDWQWKSTAWVRVSVAAKTTSHLMINFIHQKVEKKTHLHWHLRYRFERY